MEGGVCTEQSLLSPQFQRWAAMFNHAGMLHRKVWEWCFIAEALNTHGALRSNARGIGFAVGGEPLTSCFASFGAHVTATDLNPNAAEAAGWIETAQHASSRGQLNSIGLCAPEEFEKLVEFEYSDMNAVPDKFHDSFDFLWSSCALEHLGSIAHGERFIYESAKCLKPGGVAVHTTEYNVSSNGETLECADLSIFRRQDIERILDNLRSIGHQSSVNWDNGSAFNDFYVDIPPFTNIVHLKLRLGNFTVTSLGLVIVKGRPDK
jgi:SAM-dependent methyltransferase